MKKASWKQRNGLQKWGKNMQAAAYNGAQTVDIKKILAINLLININLCSFKSLLWCDTTFDILTSSQEGLVCHSKAQSTFCKNCQFCSITWVTFKTTLATQCFHEELIINFHDFFVKTITEIFFSKNSIDFYARSQLTFWRKFEGISMFLIDFLNKFSAFFDCASPLPQLAVCFIWNLDPSVGKWCPIKQSCP